MGNDRETASKMMMSKRCKKDLEQVILNIVLAGVWSVCGHSRADDQGKEENGGHASIAKKSGNQVHIHSLLHSDLIKDDINC